MKRFGRQGIVAVTLIALVLLIGTGAVLGQAYPGMMHGGRAGTPQAGGMMNGVGPGGYGGMMAGYGPAVRGYPGMMDGNGVAPGSGMMPGYGPMGGVATNGTGQPVTSLDQAQQAVQAYVDRYGNADLAIDEVMEYQRNFYAIVKEKSSGIGSFEVLVDKQTGATFPEYGPNMMWSTKYGMMRSQNDATQPMVVSADQATKLASDWLAQNQSGATTEAPNAFYGYYTLHILQGGKVTGMLSVNGYSGTVWSHTWHGAFIQMKEAGA
jgi:hypothetical protein